jgi:prepilin-type N-terminal cleavage/methylation domain-containing protein/prepilin-type processing-associated H-X9-DG protein
MSVCRVGRTSSPSRGRAFTLIELLVVVSIIAIIASLILPALARAKARAQGSFCLNNTRQLAVAWMLYADEHNGLLAYNLGQSSRTAAAVPAVGSGPTMADNWVNNVLNWELSPDNTNVAAVIATGIGPYTGKSAPMYRCPSDRIVSDLQRTAGWDSRVRSYSMNAMIGDAGFFTQSGVNINNSNYVQFFKSTSIPHPSDIFVFVDEHPDSIDDGYFLDSDSDPPMWTDLPASYHDGAANFSFADGHSERHRWHNASTKQPSRAYGINPPLPMPITDGVEDFSWVLARMSMERNPGGYVPPNSNPPSWNN